MSRTHRHRHDEAQFDLDQLPEEAGGGADAMLVQTFTETTYPTTASTEYACHPISEIDSDEAEGASVSFTADSSVTIYALNVGSTVPPSGTKVIAHAVGGRWAFRYDS